MDKTVSLDELKDWLSRVEKSLENFSYDKDIFVKFSVGRIIIEYENETYELEGSR